MHIQRTDFPAYLAIVLLSCLSILGIMSVPFHPDESTYLFMSSDFDLLLSNPLAMKWHPEKTSPRQTYRLLDAPLTRYWLGLSGKIGGTQPLSSDWDWAKTWDENAKSGALPTAKTLFSGRLGMTLLLPLTLLSLYHLTKSFSNQWGGMIAIIFFGTNALILLHARRAMAEGLLVFGIAISLVSLLKADEHPWLTGLAIAFAFNAKQSTIALLPVGLLAVCWLREKPTLSKIISNTISYLVSFLVLTLLLNPILWKNPVQTIEAAIHARQVLTTNQVNDIASIASERIMDTPQKRIIAMIAHVFITPPAFSEVGNYLQNTKVSETKYSQIMSNNLWRGFLPGAVVMIFTLTGFFSLLIEATRSAHNREIDLIILATLSQTLVLLVALPLPWQRYYLPLIPLTAFWFAIGIYTIGSLFGTRFLPGRTRKVSNG